MNKNENKCFNYDFDKKAVRNDEHKEVNEDKFKCDCCGLCCMNLQRSAVYADLDRGDGICQYFDIISKLCTIYENRPEKCNIDKVYEKFVKNKMSLKQYYELNYEACRHLKQEEEKNVFNSIK